MTHDEQMIDQIVRSVLARMQASGGCKPPDAGDRAISLNAKVITGDLLESTVNGTKNVTIGQQAVLTPSARDIIRQRGITIQRGTESTSAAATSNRWHAIVVKSTPALEGALSDAMNSSEMLSGRKLVGSNDEAAQTVINDICRAEADGVVVFSEHPQLVACLSNRNRSVRAAIADNAATIKAVSKAMSANVFCVNPVDQPWFHLRNILRQLPASKRSAS